jgi:hypothetical protein
MELKNETYKQNLHEIPHPAAAALCLTFLNDRVNP